VKDNDDNNASIPILILLRANLTAKKPITELARVKNEQTQKDTKGAH
jgi:hypothetical protein